MNLGSRPHAIDSIRARFFPSGCRRRFGELAASTGHRVPNDLQDPVLTVDGSSVGLRLQIVAAARAIAVGVGAHRISVAVGIGIGRGPDLCSKCFVATPRRSTVAKHGTLGSISTTSAAQALNSSPIYRYSHQTPSHERRRCRRVFDGDRRVAHDTNSPVRRSDLALVCPSLPAGKAMRLKMDIKGSATRHAADG
ncbi:MAG: hypothetical protein ABWZ78_06520 [Burkholderiaceae bacterium]